jgi:hypothetical protein
VYSKLNVKDVSKITLSCRGIHKNFLMNFDHSLQVERITLVLSNSNVFGDREIRLNNKIGKKPF